MKSLWEKGGRSAWASPPDHTNFTEIWVHSSKNVTGLLLNHCSLMQDTHHIGLSRSPSRGTVQPEATLRSLEFFIVRRQKVCQRNLWSTKYKFYFIFLLYIWLKGYSLGMNCSFHNNPPNNATAVCIYIQYQKTLSTSVLVITFSVQAGKQVVPGTAELGQPEFPWTCIPLCLQCPSCTVGEESPLYPSQGEGGFHRLLVT